MISFFAQFLIARWPLRWAPRLIRWTVTAVVLVAAAPVTIVAADRARRGVAARVAAGPAAPRRRLVPAHDRRLAGRPGRHRPVAGAAVLAAPYRDGGTGGTRSASATPLHAFVLCAPVAVPAGLLVASLGVGARGSTGSRPAWPAQPRPRRSSSTQRQWRRQARTARAGNAAPGTVPLTDRKGRIVMGATSAPSATAGSPVLAIAARGDGPASGDHRLVRAREDEPDDAHLGRLVHRRPATPPRTGRATAAAGGAGLQGRTRRPRQSRPHPPAPARRRSRAGSRSGPTRPPCRCGRCRPAIWP